MDLTTAESTLLQGGIYNYAQEFINDVALVFANGIEFNRAGHDEGAATPSAYFEASKHLLKYARWLSLESLSAFLVNDTDRVSQREEGSIEKWKLSTSYRQDAKSEMEGIVLKRQMELSEIGERYTWMESECEKLLKSLRYQSDWKHMSIYVKTIYPPDYTAYIAKPRDWTYCDTNLKKRKYKLIGEFLEDVKLIFSNALKYNVTAKDTNKVSGSAYNSALIMAKKLETAIDKMLISISERIGRDEVDKNTERRELDEVQQEVERQEKEQMLLSLSSIEKKKEESNNIHVLETVTLVHQRPRQESIDIDFEFSDDEEGSHELAHLEAIRRQKNIFHLQLRARQELLMLARTVGSRVMQLAVCQQDPQFNYDSRGLPISLRDPFHKRNFESLDPPVNLADGLENDPRVIVPVKTKIMRCRNPIRMSLKKGKVKKTRHKSKQANKTFQLD